MGFIKKAIAGIKKIRNRRDARKLQEGITKMGFVSAAQAPTQLSQLGIQQASYAVGGTGISAPASYTQLPGLQQVGLFNANSAIASNTATQQQTQAGGLIPWWRGPGGKLQFPWSDPRVPEFLKAFALDDSALKIFYRAPKGYVIVKDPTGRPYAVMKDVARKFGLWTPPAKPPISATDWKNYKRNKIIEKRLLKIAAPAMRKKRASGSQPRRKGK